MIHFKTITSGIIPVVVVMIFGKPVLSAKNLFNRKNKIFAELKQQKFKNIADYIQQYDKRLTRLSKGA